MTKIEALELELKARKMVEGTVMQWWQVIRSDYKIVCKCPPPSDSPYGCELALGIIEGKPVWKGDTLYYKDSGVAWKASSNHQIFSSSSWNPPAQKTIMVELLVEDVECLTNYGESANRERKARIMEACRKALEQTK